MCSNCGFSLRRTPPKPTINEENRPLDTYFTIESVIVGAAGGWLLLGWLGVAMGLAASLILVGAPGTRGFVMAMGTCLAAYVGSSILGGIGAWALGSMILASNAAALVHELKEAKKRRREYVTAANAYLREYWWRFGDIEHIAAVRSFYEESVHRAIMSMQAPGKSPFGEPPRYGSFGPIR